MVTAQQTANRSYMLTDLPYKSAQCYPDDETSHIKNNGPAIVKSRPGLIITV